MCVRQLVNMYVCMYVCVLISLYPSPIHHSLKVCAGDSIHTVPFMCRCVCVYAGAPGQTVYMCVVGPGRCVGQHYLGDGGGGQGEVLDPRCYRAHSYLCVFSCQLKD